MARLVQDPTETLREGIRACRQGNWRQGLRLLTPLAQQEEGHGQLPGFFYGFLGHAIARCEGRRHEGLELCRHAVQVQPFQPVNHLNLARTYLLIGNRRLAVRAMKKGLALDSDHRELARFAEELGVRRSPPVSFLPRGHPLNRWIGKISHQLRRHAEESRRRAQEDTELDALE